MVVLREALRLEGRPFATQKETAASGADAGFASNISSRFDHVGERVAAAAQQTPVAAIVLEQVCGVLGE